MRLLLLAELALALFLTLGIKMAFNPPLAGVEKSLPLAGFLEQQGFAVGLPENKTEPAMLPATRADCSLRIAEISPFGWHRHVLEQLAGSNEAALFVYRGHISDSQPLWRTVFDHNWHRLKAYLGVNSPRRPVLGILASRACSLGALPWSELAEPG